MIFKISYSFLILIFLSLSSSQLNSQKILSSSETEWVKNAHYDIQRATSDPTLTEKERLDLLEKAGRTLKRYGQQEVQLKDNIALKKEMEGYYDNSKNQIANTSELYLEFNKIALKRKMKLINRMQIDLVGDQIKILVPGVTPVDLASDLVSTTLQWNLVDGTNGGQIASAKDLKKKFKSLAKSKKFIKALEDLQKLQRDNLKKLKSTLDSYEKLEKKMIKAFEEEYSKEFTDKGYENAKTKDDVYTINNRHELVGSWTYSNIGFFVEHTYTSNGNAYIRVNSIQNNYTWTTNGHLISYTNSKGKNKKTMGYKIEGNQLYYTTKKGKISGHPLTRKF